MKTVTTPQPLKVDADLLRQLGADLQGQADQVTRFDAGPVFALVAGRLTQMSQAASSNANAYAEAEHAFFDQLRAGRARSVRPEILCCTWSRPPRLRA